MEKRIGTITILVHDRQVSSSVNQILSDHADVILCRQGLPFHDLHESREENEQACFPEATWSGRSHRPVAVMSLIVEGTADRVNALTGRLGRIPGLTCKAVLAS